MSTHFRFPAIRRRTQGTLIIAIAFCALSFGAKADILMKRLEGDWKGSGAAVVGSSSASVRVRCKTANRFTENDTVLTLSGACSSTQGRRSVNAKFELSHDGKVIRHASFTLGTSTSEAVATIVNNSIRLDSQVTTPAGLIQRLRSVITFAKSKYIFVTSRLSGGRWIEQSRIIFEKRHNGQD